MTEKLKKILKKKKGRKKEEISKKVQNQAI
jgi:hypothetical protein